MNQNVGNLTPSNGLALIFPFTKKCMNFSHAK